MGVRTPPKNQEGAGTGTKTRRKRAPRQVPRPTPTGRPAPPHPHQTPQHTPPKQTSDASAHPPATGNHTENGGHTYTGRTGHTHRGGRREHRRTAHHHALTASRRPRPPRRPTHRHQKRTKARPRHPRLRTDTPRGHGTKVQAPREGNPTDRHATTPWAIRAGLRYRRGLTQSIATGA